MESCSGSHFLGRALREQGHPVRLMPVGKYLVERIYREEGLTLRQRRKRRRRVAEHRREWFHPTGPNQVWSMDIVADQLADGSRFRSLDGRGYPCLTFF